MKKLLKHIATVKTGIYAKARQDATVIYLQAKHFDENGNLLSAIVPELIVDSQTESHLLKDGDILFAAKGNKNFAAVYTEMNGLCVASSTFLVIRLTNKSAHSVSPEFIVWYMNQSSIQELLKGKARGTSIPSISKTDIEDLEIFLPNVKTQERILQITSLRNKELNLRQQIEMLRDKQIQQQINQVMNEKL